MYNKSVLLSTQPRWCFEIINGKNTELRKTKPKLQPPFKVLLYCTKPSVKGRYFVGALGFNSDELYRTPDGKIKYGDSVELMACGSENYSKDNFLNGKVIGEFICDRIDEYECEFVDDDCLETVHLIDREDCDDEDYPDRTLIWSNEGDNYNFSPDDEIIKGSRVSYKELKKYIGYGFNTFYGWHITDLKIYDKPKELSEFYPPILCSVYDKIPTKQELDIDLMIKLPSPQYHKSFFCKKCKYYNGDFGTCDRGYKLKPITRAPQSWCYVEGE